MKFNHLFYNSEVNFNSISKKKIVLSILFGLVSAIILYSFYYVLRETDRFMFLDFENRLTIISETDRHLYNLFFAAISMILGNSIAISFLFARPQKVFSRRNNKRMRILNDQAFLGVNFIHWFTKIWFLFCLFASQFMGSSFITNFMLPSILLIIVLYLDSWKALILVIKKNRWKIQVIHFFMLAVLTLVLSRCNVIDYKSFDESMLLANPTVEVPSSFYEKDNYRRYYDSELVFKMDMNSNSKIVLLNVENKDIEFYDIQKIIIDYKNQYSYLNRIFIKLRANKNIPIKYIKQFELEVLDSNEMNIIYEVSNDDETTAMYFNNQLKHKISLSLFDELPPLDGRPPRINDWGFYRKHKFKDTIRLNVSDKVKINNIFISVNMLSKQLGNHINKSTIIEYIYSEGTTYQDYINVLSAHKIAVWELRATENFEEILERIHYNQFSRDQELNNKRDRIREKYPLRITERFE